MVLILCKVPRDHANLVARDSQGWSSTSRQLRSGRAPPSEAIPRDHRVECLLQMQCHLSMSVVQSQDRTGQTEVTSWTPIT